MAEIFPARSQPRKRGWGEFPPPLIVSISLTLLIIAYGLWRFAH